MNEVKHFRWQIGDDSGRIAVANYSDYFTFQQIAGKAPTPAVLESVFSELDLWDRAHELHRARKCRWAIEARQGLSGCEDFFLRVERNAALMDHPRVAHLHISMEGKLNEGFRAWLGDCIPLFQASGIGGDEPLPEDLTLKEVPTWVPPHGWKAPGANLGGEINRVAVLDIIKTALNNG